ncbi:MAG: hypothetical protein HN905_03255 [Candidatus Marinimicrobia bacterium]|jgi:hypothetical protein|nr:hypothetical protein [Candidatus Neomarinimicrobiota bacterium]
MATSHPKGLFPSQSVSNSEKSSQEYGAKIGMAIESEWFKQDSGTSRYQSNRENFHRLRLYARGEQSIQKYKDELSINGDLSYLNIDWKPVPIIPKFVDIVVNGIAGRMYDVKAYSQDPVSVEQRAGYMDNIISDMNSKSFIENVDKQLGISLYKSDPSKLPADDTELSVHMQLDYKQGIEIAQEEAISNVLDKNKFDLTKRRLDYDITVLGIGCVKNGFNKSEGITINYVDPTDIIYSFTESPYFDDLYYVGEIRKISIVELKKQFPNISDEEIKNIEDNGHGSGRMLYNKSYGALDGGDDGFVYVLYFEYKSYKNQTYKIKETTSGGKKAIKKDDNFNPPKDQKARFEKVDRAIEVLYSGAKIIGSENILEWKLAENMTRPKSDTTKVQMSYNIVAPRMYKGRLESLVSRMTTFADMIQLTHLKLQQVLARMVPDGVFLDADGIAEVDLGNGTNYNPQEALNMYFQTGSVIGRSMTQDGEFNNGRVPIQELQTGSGGAKIQSLITAYNYYLQGMRDVTGLNEARDGSKPDPNALVGLEKLAAANSNTATRHVLQSGLYLSLKTAEAISLRISDVLEFANTKNAFINSLGRFNVASLKEVSKLHLHDFGIFLEIAPDDEEKQLLENNIQMSLSKDQVKLEDAIDIRDVKNLKLANQLLKLRRRKKMEEDQAISARNMELQSKSNAEAAQAAAAADIQKNQIMTENKVKMNQAQVEFDIKKMEREAAIKKELMLHEFQLNVKLKEMDLNVINDKEKYKEDRKDGRTKIQASQQSELIEQRKNNTPPKNFESAGFDSLGGFGLEQFEPR